MHEARRLIVCVVAAMLMGSLNGQVSNPAAFASCRRSLRELIRGLADARLFAPRLAALPNWSSCELLRSGTGSWLAAECAGGVSPSKAIRRIGHEIESDARKKPAGETLYALGLWRLISASRLEEADLAVSSLRQAAAYLPDSGEIWNDLAVAYYVRGDKRGNPEDFVRSLAACDRALQANPRLRVALFNRALALTALYLRGESARAWQQFLIAGDSPEWKREARRRLEASVMPERPRTLSLSQLLASEFFPSGEEIDDAVAADPVDAFRFVELNLLGDPVSPRSAEENLRLAHLAAAALHRRFGDRLLTDEVAAWKRVIHQRGERHRFLAAGYENFRRGVSLYEVLDTARAGRRFAQATRELRNGGSPLQLWSLYWTAVCDYWNGDLAGAKRRLRALQVSAASESPILQGYAALMLGLIAADGSDFDQALEQYRGALASFEQAGASEAAGFSHTLLAQVFEKVNDPHAGWQHLHWALASVKVWRNQRWRHALFAQTADSVQALGEPETALYFQDASSKAALQSGQAAAISEEYAFHSLALARLGRMVPAAADAVRARYWLGEIVDSSVRQRMEDSVLVAEAHVAGSEHPTAAVDALGKAIQDRRRQGTTALLAELEFERGRLLAGLKRTEEAERSLLGAVEAIEAVSSSLRAEQRRSAYFALAHEIFDEMIRFELDVRKSPRAALVFADRARVHEFLTARVNSGRHPTLGGLDSLQARLSRKDGVLVYRTLEDRLLLWLVKRDEVLFRERNLPARDLAALIGNLIRSLHDPLGRTVPFGQAEVARWRDPLYVELIAPVAPSLAGVERLWIVPDGPLFQLPFAILADPVSERFLCEGRRLAKALTAGLGEETFPTVSRREPSRLGSMLAVGDPEFSRASFQDLPRLLRAREEAAGAAAAYLGSTVLIGAAATRGRFLAEIGHQDVVHFAGHALINREDPELSMLVLAPDAGGKTSGALYASDIERLALERTRLVVLSACRTTGEEGMAGSFYGLARPFLAAGVPVVVGSLWEVDDALTSQFFATFHHALRHERQDPLGALQHSQIADLNHGKSAARAVYRWAAFEVYVARPQDH